MEFPAPRRRGQSPSTKNSFQRELDATMRDRKSRGLVANIPDSDQDSDEGLESDDGQFNVPLK